MAFALVAARAYGIEADEATTKKFTQYLRLDITAANTDIALDLGTYAGTFWTAVGGTEPGATALKTIKDINIRAKQLFDVKGQALLARIQVLATPGASQYTVAMNGTNLQLPDIGFNSGSAPTAYSVILIWDLKDNEYPINITAP